MMRVSTIGAGREERIRYYKHIQPGSELLGTDADKVHAKLAEDMAIQSLAQTRQTTLGIHLTFLV
eukprot:2735707-Amphidinium_carterae.3